METNTKTFSVPNNITDLSDAALDVFLDVKSGADCVLVEHLSPAERLAVCAALGVSARSHWIMGAPHATPVQTSRKRVDSIDHEAMILDRQDEFYDE